MRYIGRLYRFFTLLVVIFSSAALVPGPASAAQCPAPKEAAKASLELRAGELGYVHDLDTAGLKKIVDGLQGYVAGPWHVPLGLTVADLELRYETSFYYRKAQGGGHCVALAEAKFSVGYDDITVFISSDYPEGSCEYDVILAHEEEHVQINREVLAAHEGKFKEAMRRLLRGKKAIFARTKSGARAAYLKELQRQLDGVVAEMTAARNRKNGAIDTQDSYRRLMAQCTNWERGDSSSSDLDGPVQVAEAAAAPQDESLGAESAGGEQAARAVPSKAATAGTKAELESNDFIGQGRQMSKANAKQLEAALLSLPYHFPTRARLLGFCYHKGLATFGPAATLEARRRHVLWLIENQPDSPLAARPEAGIEPSGGDLADQDGYDQAKALWLEQAERYAANPAVRENAAKFLRAHDRELAESLP